MSSPIQPAKDKDRDSLLMYAPPWVREKPPVVAAHEPPIEQPPQGHVVDAAGPTFSGDLAVEDLRRRRSLTPEIVPEPKSLKGDRAGALIAMRLSGVTAIAALIAWVVVSLPAMHRQPGNDNVHTAVLPNPADGEQDQLPTATAQSPLNDRRPQANEPRANGGPEERQSGIATVMAGPVADPIMPATASSSTVSQLERTTAQPDDRGDFRFDQTRSGFPEQPRLLVRSAVAKARRRGRQCCCRPFAGRDLRPARHSAAPCNRRSARSRQSARVVSASGATRLGRCFAALGKTRTVASMSGSANHARSASALANARLRSGRPLPSCATPISHTQSNLFRHLLPRGIAMLYESGRGQRPPHFNRLREKDRSSLHVTC